MQTAGVAELKVAGKPEVAVALRVAEVPTCWVGMAVKVIVCDARTRNLAVKLADVLGAVTVREMAVSLSPHWVNTNALPAEPILRWSSLSVISGKASGPCVSSKICTMSTGKCLSGW